MALPRKDKSSDARVACIAKLEHERNQYAYAIRQLILQVRQTTQAWVTTMPESVSTAGVAQALNSLCSPVVTREGLRGGGKLRDDLWSAIVGAYYLRFQNDGHPEDSMVAADEAMAIVQPELNRLTAQAEKGESKLAAYERGAAQSVVNDSSACTPVGSTDDELREQCAVAIRDLNSEGGTFADLDEDDDVYRLVDTMLTVRDRRMERLAAEVERQVDAKMGVAGEWGNALADKTAAETAVTRVRDELDALNAEVRGLSPVALAGRRDAVARIRSALDGTGNALRARAAFRRKAAD